MISNELVSEYAIAIFELINESKKTKECREDLINLINCFEQEIDFYKIFISNNLANEEKKQLISKIFKGKINQILLNSIFYVIDNGDEKIIISIFKKTINLLDDKLEIINIKIYSSFELNESDIKKIGEKIKQKTKKQPMFKVIIDKSLIGGIKVCYENTVLDNSIKNKLSVIRNEIRKGRNYESK